MLCDRSLCVFHIALTTLLVSVPLVADDAVRFQFDIGDEESYRMISMNDQTISLNEHPVREAQIVTRVQIDPDGSDDRRGRYRARFFLTESDRRLGDPVGFRGEYRSVYTRDPRGFMEIDAVYLMPVARELPIFPDSEVGLGERWTAPAHEVHDLSVGYGLSEPLRMTFPVSYRYVGPGRWRGREVHIIEAEINIAHRERRAAELYPAVVSGRSSQVLYWDLRRGRLAGSEEEYWIHFLLSDGQTITYEGRAVTEVLEARPLDRSATIDTMERLLEESDVRDVSVVTDGDGVSIVLENVAFPPDSARILPEEEARLRSIARILERYRDHDILITGHTALAGMEEGRRALSIERSRAVGDFLLRRGTRRPEQILYRGAGADEPIADNRTEAGRRMNRRVEITVLDN
ncbi:MAG: OmpA family protein [Spirochaetales bacterium]|nr:OmpA family protein [Spirochaetales bacterium]